MLRPLMMAPDFQADAYFAGNKITVSLSDYLDNYLVLFFYSSDFTFV
ncbi:MAG: alkyl hydroperoxide reductase [Gracilibacter sp. BRH_c7a]|nr:MAG: alkyl hydroperoxide reductase [Gracilibacter sp. BRH_c7a]